MKRRNFLKTLAVGGVAGVTLPPLALTPDGEQREAGEKRDRSGALIAHLSEESRVRSGMALGGIGAGTIELRKDGRFYNWNIFNNFPKETGSEFVLPEGEIEDPMASNLFFMVRYEVEGGEPGIKLLQLTNSINEGGVMGIAFTFPWMRAINRIDSSARFPFTRMTFTDPDLPCDIEMIAWTPFIPHDVKNSALPLAFFDFKVTVKTSKRVHLTLLMTARNNVGYDTLERFYTTETSSVLGARLISMGCGGIDTNASTWGQVTLASLAADSTYYCGWSHHHPFYEQVLRNRTLPNIDDTNGIESNRADIPAWLPRTHGRNRIDPKGQKRVHDQFVYCTLAKSFELAGSSVHAEHSFLYGWNFPNLYAESSFREQSQTIEGHYYSNYFTSASDVAEYGIAQRHDLLLRSQAFVSHFFDSSADIFVLEQVNSQLNTFVTNGRLVKNGDFGMLEGLSSTWSWGPIATIDVMAYSSAPIIALFPELQKATMRCHQRVQSAQGEIQHGLLKNFTRGEDGTAGVSHRLDPAVQYVIIVLRDFFWTNDRGYLEELYPSVTRAINYILTNRSFGGGVIPIMRGVESSYDNFPMFGYASYILSQWLCAIQSAVLAADAMNDPGARLKYENILRQTKDTLESKLWAGSYYRLYNDLDNAGGKGDSSEQCLTDQLVGQWMSHASGLGSIVAKRRIDTALKSILKRSYRPAFGLRNCSWPGMKYWSDVDPNTWADQGNTCWSGVELAFASFLLYEGFYEEAIEVIRTVDRRYRENGLYWSHQEFGGHYLRPMSAWSILNGLLGFSVNQGRLRFEPKLNRTAFKLFFATPTGTAHYIRVDETVKLRCLTGTLEFSSLEIRGEFHGAAILPGSTATTIADKSGLDGLSKWAFGRTISLRAGEEVKFL
jgi:uncharacterized protein (DUF608 family)